MKQNSQVRTNDEAKGEKIPILGALQEDRFKQSTLHESILVHIQVEFEFVSENIGQQ